MRPQYSREPAPMPANIRPIGLDCTQAKEVQLENPRLLSLAQNLRSYLMELAEEQASMERALYGTGTGHSDDPVSELEPTNLETLLTEVCSRAACCVGAQRSMNGRL